MLNPTTATARTAAPGPAPQELLVAGISYRRLGMLKSDFFSDNHLLERDGRKFVLKRARFRHVGGSLLEPLAGRISRREAHIYSLLDGIPGIPRYLGTVGPDAYFHEYVEGENLSQHERRRGKRSLPADFFDRLGEILARVHERGVAYGDLCKKGNVIVGADERPYLIDFTISFSVHDGPRAFRHARRWFFDVIREADRYHLAKFKRHYQPERLTDDEWWILENRPLLHRVYRVIGQRPYQFAKHLVYPKGSNEVFRFSRDLRKVGD
ncbi:MAG: hypothetical protein HYZ53_12085 [Planctomycetes bacterium]|nr:hypothetical protein [Planctomycetota bacterium]